MMIEGYLKIFCLSLVLIAGVTVPAMGQKALIPTGEKPAAGSSKQVINLVGNYDVSGTSPDQDGNYRGTLVITKTKDTYQVTWTLGNETNFGTGLLQGDSFAVAYTNSKGSFFGLVMYKVLDGGKKLDGIWTMAGANIFGKETLTRQAERQ